MRSREHCGGRRRTDLPVPTVGAVGVVGVDGPTPTVGAAGTVGADGAGGGNCYSGRGLFEGDPGSSLGGIGTRARGSEETLHTARVPHDFGAVRGFASTKFCATLCGHEASSLVAGAHDMLIKSNVAQ